MPGKVYTIEYQDVEAVVVTNAEGAGIAVTGPQGDSIFVKESTPTAMGVNVVLASRDADGNEVPGTEHTLLVPRGNSMFFKSSTPTANGIDLIFALRDSAGVEVPGSEMTLMIPRGPSGTEGPIGGTGNSLTIKSQEEVATGVQIVFVQVTPDGVEVPGSAITVIVPKGDRGVAGTDGLDG